ncbi:Hamartin protein-domain-containing protein [Phaeosphaeriaceae sp. PMI808]|nr:Hamartin protein-domain-containing protein [Phaeosphaeriaceae sp. PMI808]
MRETVKALNTTFASPTVPYPLPDELCATVENFLERYDNIDDNDSQRFHDDLHTLYQRHIVTTPEKHGAFLALLRLVRPALTGEVRLTVWWNLALKPTVDGVGHKRHEIEDASDFIQSILVYDAEADKDGEHSRLSVLFTKRLLEAYLARTNVPLSAEDTISPENELVSHQLESILIAFGRKMPKPLLLALDELFVQKQYRIQALNLLSGFVRLQPPHLHLVLDTPLIQHLEKCLLIDASSTVIELALVVLIMFLPHICASLTADHHLAKMFLIYSRLLCWDRLGSAENGQAFEEEVDDGGGDESEQESDAEDAESEQPWEPVQQSMEYPDSSPPTLMHYFTFLYGLFPLNFMSFVRKPRRFLKSLNFPGARDFDLDQDLIQSRTEPYRRVHLLHPHMFNTTVEDELLENRWLKSDPADVVTECMDLCVAVSSTLEDPGPPPSAALPAIPVPPIPETSHLSLDDDSTIANGSTTSWRNTQSTVFVPDVPQTFFGTPPGSRSIKSPSPLLKDHDVADSPTLPPVKDVKNEAGVAKQPSLDGFVHSVTTPTSPNHTNFNGQTMSSLQREIMLLRNDLNFERYLKLQHVAHIGQLQRKNIKEATVDAETQNLINTNKTLKARLAKANELYTQLKKETLTSRNQSKKWGDELGSKVKTYRESEKASQGEEGRLRYDLHRTQSDYEHLKQIIEKAEGEQIRAQQRTRALEIELEDYGSLQRELKASQEKVLTLEAQGKNMYALIQERNDLRNDLEMTNQRLNSRELEYERSFKAYERRIMELESRLQSTERSTGRPGQLPASVQQMLDSALAANTAKLQQLKKAHHHLLNQHTELQMKYHDLEGERQYDQGSPQGRAQQFDFETTRLGRSSGMRHTSNLNTRYVPPLAAEPSPSEERERYHDYQPSSSVSSPISNAWPSRSIHQEPIQRPQRSQTTPMPYPGFGGGMGPEFSSAYDSSLSAQFQSSQHSGPQSSGKSNYSVDTEGSGSRDKKEKVDPKSEVRYYGRGGAQNITKKKDKEQKKSSSSKTGGFRGLKGIM